MSTPAFTNDDSKLDRLLRWRNGETPGPWQITVFPTNRCNLNCSICWQRGLEEKCGKLSYDGELSDAHFLKLVDDAAALGVKEWSIAGGGEPLVRAKLVMEMCALIRDHGMNGGLYTNATLLKREHIDHLINIGWQRLDISLDGPDAATNDVVRGAGCFDRVIKTLQLVKQAKEAHNSQLPVVDIHCVLTRHNVDKMEDMMRLVRSFGIKHMGFSILLVESEKCASFQLSDEQWKQLPELTQRAHELQDTLDMETSVGTVAESVQQITVRTSSKCNNYGTLLGAGCFEPFLSIAVLSEGYVGPCCVFWDEQADNLRDKALIDIWTGPWFQQMRERMFSRDFPSFCDNCPSHYVWLNEKMRRDLEDYIAKNPLPPRTITKNLYGRLRASIKYYGVLESLRRAWEWFVLSLIYTLKAKDNDDPSPK